MRATNRWVMFAVLPALLVLVAPAEVEAARFHILGASAGDSYTRVSDVSADGTIAVGSYTSFGYGVFSLARRWNADGELLSADYLGGKVYEGPVYGGILAAVSGDGSVVIGSLSLSDPRLPQVGRMSEAFRWTSGAGAVRLGRLSGDDDSAAQAVSADGSTVVGRSQPNARFPDFWSSQAFRWTQSEGMIGLGILPGQDRTWSWADAVSADGSVIVGSSGSASGAGAFRWTADGGMVGLGWLTGQPDSYAQDVSADGAVVVGFSGTRRWSVPATLPWEPILYPLPRPYSDPGDEAFIWTEADGMVGLGYLPGHAWSQAYAVSADGSIVVGASAPVVYDGLSRLVGTREAFIWDAEHGMRNLKDLLISEYQLDLPDWSLGHPTGISADGKVIVGNGGNPGVGVGGAWMVVIPEPSTIVLALSGLLALLVCAWRKRRHAA